MDEEEDYITFYGEMVECFRIASKKIVSSAVSLLDKLQFEFECLLLADNCNDLFF